MKALGSFLCSAIVHGPQGFSQGHRMVAMGLGDPVGHEGIKREKQYYLLWCISLSPQLPLSHLSLASTGSPAYPLTRFQQKEWELHDGLRPCRTQRTFRSQRREKDSVFGFDMTRVHGENK